MSIIIGTTNTDGTGSSVDLDENNGTYINDDSSLTWNEDGVTVESDNEDHSKIDSITINSDEWNKEGYKEANLNSEATYIDINNVVDVNIVNNTASHFSEINVMNVKRGQVDTSNGVSNDVINVGVKSNSDSWSNHFDINSGHGNDEITMTGIEGSQYTSFSIDAGKGNDTVDVSGMAYASSADKERHIEGGKGFDTLITNGDDTITFEGFEVVQGTGFDQTLTLDSDALAANYKPGFGLVVSDIDVEFSDDVTMVESHDLGMKQVNYLERMGLDSDDYHQVNVVSDGVEYTILTNDDSFDIA
ncbi:hypothetical protein AB2S62_16450 [Vibrio sp. NTOU-M3]|uniref:hypothetical protein n=1 Tax=Vibrio sp. NTOU-M3 TaxID=3234954 RepID=UPI00349F3639